MKKITCATCKWGSAGDDIILHKCDMVCVNHKSPHRGDFVRKKQKCEKWEAK